MQLMFSLVLPRDAASVPVARHLFRDALSQLGVERDCIADIELALTEACTNVLRHARGQQDDGYEVRVDIDEERCLVVVSDLGIGFDPGAFGGESSGDSSEGGRGIFLMRTLVDELEFDSHPGGTIVSLTKTLTTDRGSPLRVLHNHHA